MIYEVKVYEDEILVASKTFWFKLKAFSFVMQNAWAEEVFVTKRFNKKFFMNFEDVKKISE